MGISSSSKPEQVATLTPEQKQLLDQLIGGTSNAFSSSLNAIFNQLDPEKTNAFFQSAVADPAIANFKSQILPSIQQAGADLGAKGGSSIERQLAQAGASLQSDLAQQLGTLQFAQQQQGIQNVQSLLGQSLGTEAFALQQPGLSPMAQLLAGAGGEAADILGKLLPLLL